MLSRSHILMLLALASWPVQAQDDTADTSAAAAETPGPAPAEAEAPDEAAPDQDGTDEETAPGDAAPDDAAAVEAAPVEEAPAPVADAPAPVEEAPAPVADPPPAPVDESPAPDEQAVAEPDPADSGAAPAADGTPAKKPDDKPAADKAEKAKDDIDQDKANAAAANGLIGVSGKNWVFRGSSFTLRNTFAPIGLLKNAELTWNPTYAVTAAFSPTVWIGNHINVGAYLDVTRELTQNDGSTYEGEWVMSDLWLTAGALNFWTIPFLGINLTATGNARVPTSKLSWANTMVTAVGGNFTMNRPFPVLSGLIFGGSVGGTKFFHRYTTGENESSLEEGGCFSVQYCGIFASNGVRNVDFSLQGRLFGMLIVDSWLGFFVDGRLIYNQLYPLVQKDPRVTFDPTNPDGRFAPVTGRYLTWTRASVFSTPHPAVTFFLSTSTLHPQLAPDGSYYFPVFNRFTQVNFDVQLNMGGIASLFFD